MGTPETGCPIYKVGKETVGMTEKDDQLKDEAEDVLAEQDDATVFSALPEETDDKFAQTAGDVAGGGIAGGEVRLVTNSVVPKSSNLPLVLLLLFVVLVGIGYYLMTSGMLKQNSPAAVASAPTKQPMPERLSSVEPVKEESVEQPAVASAEPQVVKVIEAPPKAPVAPKPAVLVETKPAEAVIYSVLVGPYVSLASRDEAALQLKELGFDPQKTKGRGMVAMTRLLEGVYPVAEAQKRLVVIKEKTGDAFMLPTGEQWAIYVGSFSRVDRASNYAEQLAEKGIKVSLVSTDVEMNGKMLLAVQADQKTARQVAELIGKSGLNAQVVRK